MPAFVVWALKLIFLKVNPQRGLVLFLFLSKTYNNPQNTSEVMLKQWDLRELRVFLIHTQKKLADDFIQKELCPGFFGT